MNSKIFNILCIAVALLACESEVNAAPTTYTYSYTAPSFTNVVNDANLSRQFTTSDYSTFSFTTDALLKGTGIGTYSLQAGNASLLNPSLPNNWILAGQPTTVNVLSWSFQAGPVTIDNMNSIYSNYSNFNMFGGTIQTDANGMPANFLLSTYNNLMGTTMPNTFRTFGFSLQSNPLGSNASVLDYLSPTDISGHTVASVASTGLFPNTWTLTSSVAAVPEPGEYLLMLIGIGLTGLFAVRRKKMAV